MIGTYITTNISQSVKNVLEADIQSRDNDDILWLKIATEQISLGEYPQRDLLWHIVNGNLYSYSRVSRARRALQAKHEHLRGANWEKNQKYSSIVSAEFSR
jgi:hypothetical protein